MYKITILTFLALTIVSCSKEESQPTAENENIKKQQFITQSRGIWWWQDTESAYGTYHVIGNHNLENYALLQFKCMAVDKVYGCYHGSLFINAPVLKNWNSKLYNQKITSCLLLGEPTWIYPNFRPNLIEIVNNNVIRFNKSCQLRSETFKELHLDIEPHTLPDWNFPKRRRTLANLLLETYKEVRSTLDKNGLTSLKLYADLPDWFDNYETNNTVGWSSATDRDRWYNDLSNILNGLSLMAYEKQINSVINTTAYERSHCTIPVEIGLNFEDALWNNSYFYFMQNVGLLEEASQCKVIIHSYTSIAPANPIDGK